MDRREARRQYKERITPKGIFAVRCAAVAGQTWVGSSTHLDSARTSLWFQLRGGGNFTEKTLQAAWKEHGEAAFAFEILETLDEEVVKAQSPVFLKDLLAERLKHWEFVLAAIPI